MIPVKIARIQEQYSGTSRSIKDINCVKGGSSDVSGLFGSDCVLWDLPDELTNHIV
jgi:transcription factor MYB, plant